MKRLEKTTLVAIRDQLAGYNWHDQELDEIVAPKFGIITPLQTLLDDLGRLRGHHLGSLPPEEPLRPRKSAR
jgi:hypothetical protein